MKKVAVIFSGCGYLDGAEVQEAVCALLYLGKAGAEMQYFAPDVLQRDVIDHNTGQPEAGNNRNVLIESARIARGNVKPLSKLNVDQFDAIVIPGGYGAVKNFSSFAVDGPDCKIDKDMEAIIKKAVESKKVIGAICVTPVVVARALRDTGANPVLTIGNDKGTMDALKALNATPKEARVTDILVDEKNRIVSSPAYMLGPGIVDVATGIEKLIKKVLEMA